MQLKLLVGGVLAVVLLGLGWQQRTMRQMQTELAELTRSELPAEPIVVESTPNRPEPEPELTAARAEVRALQMRVNALEARLQALTLELEQERQQQRQLGSNSTALALASADELKAQVMDPHRGWKDRFRAFRTLMRQGLMDAQTTTAFLDEVMKLNDDELTAELFGVLDNTGNLAAAPALIRGLQLDKVELRMRALDALSEMQSDATVVQWLQHVARTDAEERVRAEAVRVLAQAGNQP
jgi:HEAT repeat protein